MFKYILHKMILISILFLLSFVLTFCSSDSNTTKKGSDISQAISGTGKEALLKWFNSNFKYASMKDFMEKREQQINLCIEERISCQWILGSAITTSSKGYVVSFQDNRFTIEEFPAGSESAYGISNKDVYFKPQK